MEEIRLAGPKRNQKYPDPVEVYEEVTPDKILFGVGAGTTSYDPPNNLKRVQGYRAAEGAFLQSEDDKVYYIEQAFELQGMKDLYAYTVLHGPIMMSEFGFIAHQLLWKVREFHRCRIVLKYLAPQYVVIRDGFTRGMP